MGIWCFNAICLVKLCDRIYSLPSRFRNKHVIVYTDTLGGCYILLIVNIMSLLRIATGVVQSTLEIIILAGIIIITWLYLYFIPKVLDKLSANISRSRNQGMIE